MKWLLIVISQVMAITAFAGDFLSPNKVLETCRVLPHLSNAKYSSKDIEKEAELCGLNFYNNQYKVCGKSWSTSPTTLLLSVEQTPFTASTCTNKKSMDAFKKEAKFKVSMNEQGTSGTFSPSSILYYHLSRYLNLSVDVPVAVYRTMDKRAHYNMVSSQVVNFENDMVKTAWDYLKRAESQNINAMNPANETFTTDGQQLFGSLIDSIGNAKYGEHIRGVKADWGEAQHLELKKTPAFVALAKTAPAVEAGDLALAETKARFPKELSGLLPSTHQMMAWMQEMSDMSIIDYIMQQQDRPGNIHFQWRILYVESGKLKSKRLKLEDKYLHYTDYLAVEKIALEQYKTQCQLEPCFVVQKTIIEDNDAGGRIYYNDFFRRAKILESFRHLNPNTYIKLLNLASDLKNQGQVYQTLKANVAVDSNQLAQIVKNTVEVATILSKNCKQISFDLDSEKYMLTGNSSPATGLCH